MSNVNKVILIGRVGKDPEVRYMPNGEAVANFSIATSETWKDKSGVKQEKTEWHNCVAYRRLAEVIGEYVKKGALLYVEGKLQTRKWQTKEGQDRYSTEIIVNEMTMLGSKQGATDAQNHPAQEPHGSSAPARTQAPSARNKPAATPGNFDNFDDDIPFFDPVGSRASWRFAE